MTERNTRPQSDLNSPCQASVRTLRHDRDCSHLEWRDGTVLGTPQLATEEPMQTLRACKTCIETHRGPHGAAGGRAGEDCIYLIFMSAEIKLSTRASGVLQLFIHDTVTRSSSRL